MPLACLFANEHSHAALERRLPLPDADLSRATHQHLVQRMLGVYEPLETQLLAAPWFFTAVLSFDPHGEGGCKYTAKAMHSAREQAQAHEQMGFSQGWGVVLDPLVEYVKTTPLD
jgi:uncharacterized protein YndB with AHSA1/START domain